MLDVTGRAGPARAGRWSTGAAKVEIPNIIFRDSLLYPAPAYADLTVSGGTPLAIRARDGDIIASYEQKVMRPVPTEAGEIVEGVGATVVRGVPADPLSDTSELVVLGNAFELRRDAEAFVTTVVAAREAAGHGRVIYAPGLMEPANLALLTYMGIDLFDSSLALYQAARGRATITEGVLAEEGGPWWGVATEKLEDHNLQACWRELQLVRHMIHLGRLRELVEIRVTASPWMVAALRMLDLEHHDFQEARASVVGPRFYCNSKASLHRPDVARFRRRIMDRWSPAPHKRVLLLIPCSARKPYYLSKSHRAFEEVLLSVPNSCAVQELIVTSPLGVVPRELELFYPAAQYDIPVTGHWDCEEVRIIQEMVSRARSFGFTTVITHLGGESGFVKDVIEGVDTTLGQSPTSPDALKRLQGALTAATEKEDKAPRADDRREMLRSQARYQFGREGGALLEGCTVVGKYPYLKFLRGGTQLGMLTPERGMLSLTMEGGQILAQGGFHTVGMGDFDLTGNLFAVGVSDADDRIRPGDEVAIVRSGELEAVGVAIMSGREMVESKRGEAVRVRHKRKRR